MASYTRLGSYLLADELTADPFGKIFRGLTIVGSTFDKHFLVREFSEEAVKAGLGERLEEMGRVSANLAGTRGFGHNYHIEGGKPPVVSMDYVPGRSLAQMIEKARHEQVPMGVDQTLSVLQGLAQALIQLHGKGIHHGLLSPHSIWMSFEGATAVLDAPYSAILSAALPKCPALAASLARYRRASANPFHQDLFALGAILYELLTFDPLPAQDKIPEALAKATLKAAQEDAPVPQEILGLLNRLLMVTQPFEDAHAFSTELERVLYDGDYSPTTFNMAFFMHTLFREENDLDSQAVKADAVFDFTPFTTVEPGTAGTAPGGMSEGTRRALKLAGGGVAVLLVLAGAFSIYNVRQRAQMESILEEARQANAAKDIELQKLAQEQWQADQKAQQLAYEVKQAKDAKARDEAQAALDQLQKDAEENRKKREELIKQKQVIQQKAPQMAPTPAPAPVATPAAAAPAPAAPSAQEAPVTVTRKAAPSIPHPNKSTLPASLQNANITVTVKVFVDNQGRPLKVLIDKGVDGSFGYNEAAREAALGSTYSPAMKGGQASTGWISLNYDFGKP